MTDRDEQPEDEIRDTLAVIFRSVFQLPPDADVRQLRQLTEEKWDSLGHVSLITAVESEFEIDVSVSDAMEMTSFEAVALVVEESRDGRGR